VAWEFRNRCRTTATAFGREAWTYTAASRPKWVEKQRRDVTQLTFAGEVLTPQRRTDRFRNDIAKLTRKGQWQ